MEGFHHEADEPVFFAHHYLLITQGGEDAGDLAPPILLPVSTEAALRPLNPGFAPLVHVPLPPPGSYKIMLAQAAPAQPPRASMLNAERVTFPVPGAPELTPLSAPPAQAAAAISATPPEPAAAPEAAISPGAAPAPAMPQPAAVRSALVQRFDPLYLFLLFVALGVGTLYISLDAVARYTLLWTTLALVGALLMLIDPADPPGQITLSGLGWGFSFGLIFSLPLLILVSSGLAALSDVLFAGAPPAVRFQMLAFVAPLGETLFFRGIFQRRRGLVAAILGAGASGVLIFWQATIGTPAYLVAAGLFTTVLAGIYGFVRLRYGLAAAYVSQVTVNLMLLFVPGLLA
jgi:hypothetical protein